MYTTFNASIKRNLLKLDILYISWTIYLVYICKNYWTYWSIEGTVRVRIKSILLIALTLIPISYYNLHLCKTFAFAYKMFISMSIDYTGFTYSDEIHVPYINLSLLYASGIVGKHLLLCVVGMHWGITDMLAANIAIILFIRVLT